MVFGAPLALESALELLGPTTGLVVAGCRKIHFSLRVTIQLRKLSVVVVQNKMTLQNNDYFDLWSAHLSNFYTFPICVKCQNDCRMVMLSS